MSSSSFDLCEILGRLRLSYKEGKRLRIDLSDRISCGAERTGILLRGLSSSLLLNCGIASVPGPRVRKAVYFERNRELRM